MQDQPTANKNEAPAPGTTVAPKTTPEDRSMAFRAVEGGTPMQSGEKLLVEAYAAIWVLVMIFLVSMFRRQKQIDARIASLEVALEKVRGRGGSQ
jgi:CcmD family protein